MIVKLNESVIIESRKQKRSLKVPFFLLLLSVHHTPRPRILILATYLLCALVLSLVWICSIIGQ